MSRREYNGRLPMAVGFAALVMLVAGLGIWSARTEIAGAIIATGTVVVENNRQVVQHAEGGVVAEIAVRDGEMVQPGDLLLQLDASLLRSELVVAELQLIELQARRARLAAERDEDEAVTFSSELLAQGGAAAAEQIEGQRVLFEARRETFARELSQIGERVRQTGNQIDGTKAQLVSLETQRALVEAELVTQQDALERGLTQAARVSGLKREAAQIGGDIGRLTSDIARLKGEVSSLEIEGVRLRNARREAAISELRDIQFRELELREQRSTLLRRLDRLDIRAPVSGVVFGSTVFAESAVLQAAEPLMYLVPQDQPLLIDARVDAIHIDQVRPGQAAMLRFSAFNQRVTPEITGSVKAVSADVFNDEVTGETFYRVELLPSETEIGALDELDLVPGMPVEVLLRTDDRTPLSYLTKPLTDYFGRAFRES